LKTLPLPVLGELANRAEGNPFFLEEIVKGIIQAGIPDFKAEPDGAILQLQSQIPESLRATLQARLDNLSREARSVALMAAVIGRVFWVGALKAVARVNTGTGTLTTMPELVMDRLIQDGLRQLVRSELAFPRAGTKFSDTQEYIFKNSYLRDVAYSMIPHRSRSIYHRAVARWLADHSDIAYKVMAAEHYEKAGVFFDAAEQYEQAIDIARTRGAQSEIESLKARAREARDAGRKAAQNG
jgi:predicted ATPase